MPLTVGTAGHIDHGKTWLVRALTGKDTDRLPEEQERGISIELGYAPLELPGDRRLSLVDVPGHERFVRTMVAGATGIDLFLLVLDAAEGARPQTHEHLSILRLLGVERGVVAVTKADAVDEETLELALEEARELAPDAEAVAVSAKTGAGLDDLRAALARAADRLRTTYEPLPAPARLYVDRVFTLRGIGTVATGTLWSGSIGEGDTLRAEPAGIDVRVRSVQVHDRPVERAEAGQRVAVSLPGIERAQLRRGDALVTPGSFRTSYRLDVALEELEPLPASVTVHHGTSAVPARVVRTGERYAQLRLAEPLVTARGDRVVLRTSTTVGGGTVLDPAPPRRVDAARLEALERGDVTALVREPVRAEELAARGLPADALAEAAGWVFAPEWLEEVRGAARVRLEERAAAEPLDPGLSPAELLGTAPWTGAVAPLLGLEARGGKLHLPGATASLRGREQAAAEFERTLARSGFEPVALPDRALAAHLEREGRLVRVGDGLAVGRAAYERAKAVLLRECEERGRVTLAGFRDALGTSRRPAQLLLERFDSDGLTQRIGDERRLRRRARPPAG
jgi:selenocysteine-specific elongation factor